MDVENTKQTKPRWLLLNVSETYIHHEHLTAISGHDRQPNQLPRFVGVSRLSNSEDPRYHFTSSRVSPLYIRTLSAVAAHSATERDVGQQDSQNFPGQDMTAARLACLTLVILLLDQLDTSDAGKWTSFNMLYVTE